MGGIQDLMGEKANVHETGRNESIGLDMLGYPVCPQDSKASFCRAWEPRRATPGSPGMLGEAGSCGATWPAFLLCPLVGMVAAGTVFLGAVSGFIWSTASLLIKTSESLPAFA